VTTRALSFSALAFLFVGCALPETPVEKPKQPEKPAVEQSASDRNNEIPLRDPDVANELPDERLTGTGTHTVGSAAPSAGTVVARPPRKPSAPAAAETTDKEE